MIVIKHTFKLFLFGIIILELGILILMLVGWLPSFSSARPGKKTESTAVSVVKQTQTTSTSEASVSQSTSLSSEKVSSRRLPVDQWQKSDTDIRFPILMYHSLTESEGNSLKIPPAEFREHLAYLKKAGYYTLTPAEAYIVLTENKKPADKIVWLTFDDGYLNNYTDGFPLLKEFEMDATINYIVAKEGNDNYFSLAQMQEMATSGFVSIESHTINHLEVNVMDYEQQMSEFKESKKYFDQALKQDTILLCYPAGRYDQNNFQALADSGYKMAVTTENGYASAADGLFALKRVRVSPGYDEAGFGNLINSFQ